MANALETLAELEGFDSGFDLLEEYALESVVPAICTCCKDWVDYLEPDARNCKICEFCTDGGSVSSALVLAGII